MWYYNSSFSSKNTDVLDIFCQPSEGTCTLRVPIAARSRSAVCMLTSSTGIWILLPHTSRLS